MNESLRILTPAGGNMTTETVTLSDAAAKRIAAILKKDMDKTAMRVSVEGGGCSGFSYKFDLVDAAAGDDDLVLEKGEAKVLIDSLSLVYMGGSEIDFIDNLMGQSFQIKNPNAVASCGCGTSFSI
jgi:iron-sulfur cluster assembly accessory protein